MGTAPGSQALFPRSSLFPRLLRFSALLRPAGSVLPQYPYPCLHGDTCDDDAHHTGTDDGDRQLW